MQGNEVSIGHPDRNQRGMEGKTDPLKMAGLPDTNREMRFREGES